MEPATVDIADRSSPVPGGDPRREVLLAEIAALLRDVTGQDHAWSGRITETTHLEDDLWLDSVEVAALGERMRDRYGVDLPGFLAACDLDQLVALTVGDLVTLIARRHHDATDGGRS